MADPTDDHSTHDHSMADAAGAAATPPAGPLEAALAEASQGGDAQPFLAALSGSPIVLPQEGQTPGATQGQVTLPVVEQEGMSYVPAFTSLELMRAAAPQIEAYAEVPGAELGAAWPAEPELWLALNPGTDQGATLPPDLVRSLSTQG